jgi:hypothetical protein
MYSHKTLRYQWMRYLTAMKEYPWDDFWKRLVDKITAKIDEAEILEPRRRGSPRYIRKIRRIPGLSQDSNGDPLFEDLPGASETYISTGYEQSDQIILADYGLKLLFQDELLARVRHDLSLPNSRMKDPKTTAEWHTRAAKAINRAWDMNWKDRIAETKALGLFPLSSGRWISADAPGVVYLPTLDSGIAIPTNLGLNILNTLACADSERLKLFHNLGVRHADVKGIRTKILQEFSRNQSLVPSHARSMLEFLYLTCTHQQNTFGQYSVVKLHNSLRDLCSPKQVDFHFPSDDAFSPWQLFLQTESAQDEDDSNPILDLVAFINEDYLKDEPSSSGILSWREWLEAAIGVRRFPRLVNTSGKGLSELCQYVAEEMPEAFLGFLQYTWGSERESVLNSAAVLEELKAVEVACDTEDESRYNLDETYLPIRGLQQNASALMEEGEDFPFLRLGGETLMDDDLGTWSFLKKDLSVGSQDDVQFYIDILYYVQLATGMLKEVERPERIIEIFGRIHNRIGESKDRASWEKKLR